MKPRRTWSKPLTLTLGLLGVLIGCAQPAPQSSTPPPISSGPSDPSPLTLALTAMDRTGAVGRYITVPLDVQGSGVQLSASMLRLDFDSVGVELLGTTSDGSTLTQISRSEDGSVFLTLLGQVPSSAQHTELVFRLLKDAPAQVSVQAVQAVDGQARLASSTAQAQFTLTPGEGGHVAVPDLKPLEDQLLKAQQAAGLLDAQTTTPPVLNVPTTLDRTWANFSLGDVDQNSKVNLADITLLTRFLLGKQVPTSYQAYTSDLFDAVSPLHKGQVVDAADLALLVAKVALIEKKIRVGVPSLHPLSVSANPSQAALAIVGNAGNGPLTVTAQADQPWIKVERLPDSADNLVFNIRAEAPEGSTGQVLLKFPFGLQKKLKVTALAATPNPNQTIGQFSGVIESGFSALTFTKNSATAPLELSAANPSWDAASHVFSADVTVKNTGTLDLPGVKAVLRKANPDTLRPINPSGYASDDAPFMEFGPLKAGQAQTLKWRIYSPNDQTGSFQIDMTSVSGKLTMTTASPASFSAANDTVVTIRGTDIRAETAFFIESTRLTVQKWTDTSAEVVVPKGFPVSTYGVMAVNPSGDRAVLYPAFSVTAAPDPIPLDPKAHARSFVDGYVIDITTKKPIEGATVGLPGLTTTTTSDGYFLLRGVPQGRQPIEISAPGYERIYRFAEVKGEQQTVTLKLAELQAKHEGVTMIGPDGGTHYANDGSFLKVPAGALNQTVPIEFTQLTGANALPQLPQDGYFLAFARLGPVGLTFNKPATLYLPLQPGIDIPVGTPIRISYYDERQSQWVQDITSGVITRINDRLFLEYEINHFTWIGGQFIPDPVTGCVVNEQGQPIAGVATNWGVTDLSGVFTRPLAKVVG